jgi:hypothetical protein
MEAELAKKALPKPDLVVRIMCMLCGIGMIVLSILNFMNYEVNSPIDVVLPLYYL